MAPTVRLLALTMVKVWPARDGADSRVAPIFAPAAMLAAPETLNRVLRLLAGSRATTRVEDPPTVRLDAPMVVAALSCSLPLARFTVRALPE